MNEYIFEGETKLHFLIAKYSDKQATKTLQLIPDRFRRKAVDDSEEKKLQ